MTDVALMELISVRVADLVPNPHQPRTIFDPDELAELAQSIKEHGVLTPVLVRRLEAGFQLVAGERRMRACSLLGLEYMPALLVDERSDDAVLALVENVQRVGLNPIDEARAYRALLDSSDLTQEDVGRMVGKSRSSITTSLSLLRLPPEVAARVAAGVLSAGHARALVAVADPWACAKLASRIVAENLSVRATEELVIAGNLPGTEEDRARVPRKRRGLPDPAWEEMRDSVVQALEDTLETRVRVVGQARRGRLVVEFGSPDDLRRILDLLRQGIGDSAPK